MLELGCRSYTCCFPWTLDTCTQWNSVLLVWLWKMFVRNGWIGFPYSSRRSAVILIVCLLFFVTFSRYYKLVYIKSISVHTARLMSCQLLWIIREMQIAFDKNLNVNVKSVLLDILKPFDKTWHNSLLFKLKTYGVEGELLLHFSKTISKILNKELF